MRRVPKVMRAWVLARQGPLSKAALRMVRVPIPRPGPGQVRVRVRACGVCHTDLHLAEGDIPCPKKRLILGHQVVGTVDALGRGVRKRRLGERVGVAWLHASCLRCADCRKGRENLCSKARFTGCHVDGGYAECHVADEGAAFPLPGRYSDAEAAPLLCAGVIGFRALRLCGVRSGQTLGLYGFGASAHLTLQAARRMGCRVLVFSRSEGHRRLARELGALWAGPAGALPPRRPDASILFAPAGALVPAALKALAPGGTLALAGITMTPIPKMEYELLYGERKVTSVANSTRKDISDFLRLASRARLRVETECHPFAHAPEVLRRLKRGEVRGAAVLVF